MSDSIDSAVDKEQLLLDKTVENQRLRAATPQLPRIGCCHYCDAPVPRGSAFCDSLCSKDYDAEQAAIARNG